MRVNRVSPTQPVTHGYYRQPEQPQTEDACTYKVIDSRAKVEEYQPDALDWFDRVDWVMEKVWPWICGFAAVFLTVHLFRALINGWLP